MTSKKNKLNLDSYIVVNPSMMDEIQSYKVIESSIFGEHYFDIPYISSLIENRDSLCATNYTYFPDKGVFVTNYQRSQPKTVTNHLDEERLYEYFLNKQGVPIDDFSMYLNNHVYRYNYEYLLAQNSSTNYIIPGVINIVVEFIYKNGHTFISSRNYPIKIMVNQTYGYDSIKEELSKQGLLFDPSRVTFAWPMPLQDFLLQ